MPDDNNLQPNSSAENQQINPALPLVRSGGQKVIQPSPELIRELQAQQITPQHIMGGSNDTQTVQSAQPQPTYSQPVTPPISTQMQVGMSASQMGYNQPKGKISDFNFRRSIIKALIGLAAVGGIVAVLVMTNLVALHEFKTTTYTNSKGNRFELDFYTKHGSKQLQSGTTQLVSKVSKDGNFPIVMSISTSDGISGYSRLKDCASFKKVFDVQNSNLNQKISVCDVGKLTSQSAPGNLYVAGFTENNRLHVITISQDYGSIDLSSQSGAQASLSKFGIEPYNEDIKNIVSSIKVR